MANRICRSCNKVFDEPHIFKACDTCRKKHREYMNLWYKDNSEKVKVWSNRWWNNNKDKRRKANEKWTKGNQTKVNEYKRNWIRNHPEYKYHRPEGYKPNQAKRRICEHNRRARIKGNGGKLPPNTETILFDKQQGRCYLCGEALYGRFDDYPTIDHKLPLARGGSNTVLNVALAHASCNFKKSTKTVEEIREFF